MFVCACLSLCLCVCMCVQPVRVRACWSAGTVSASRQHSVATARTTVRTAVMKNTAAESRVRRLPLTSQQLSSSLLHIPSLCVLQVRGCASLVNPAVSQFPVRRRAAVSTSPVIPEITTAVSPAQMFLHFTSGSVSPSGGDCASLHLSSLRAHQPGTVHEPALQPDQLPQLPGPPVPEREFCVLGVVTVPCTGPDRLLPVPHVLRLHAAGPKV